MTETTLDHEGRLSRLEGITEQINQRLDQMQQQMNLMQQQMNQRMDQIQLQMNQRMDQINQQMNQQFRWLVGIQVTTLLALGTIILAKLPG